MTHSLPSRPRPPLPQLRSSSPPPTPAAVAIPTTASATAVLATASTIFPPTPVHCRFHCGCHCGRHCRDVGEQKGEAAAVRVEGTKKDRRIGGGDVAGRTTIGRRRWQCVGKYREA